MILFNAQQIILLISMKFYIVVSYLILILFEIFKKYIIIPM